MVTVSMIYTKMSTLSPVYAKSRHVYILVQDFRLFSAMPKSTLFEIQLNFFIQKKHTKCNYNELIYKEYVYQEHQSSKV